MFPFTKKKQITENNESSDIASNLYKKNVELSVKNKTLSILSRLYEVSILALEPKDLTDRITKVIQTDLVFEIVGILLYDKEKKELDPTAFASSERLEKVQDHFNTFFQNTVLDLSKMPFLNKVILDKAMNYTENLTDVWDSILPEHMLEEITSSGHVKSSLVYPLVNGDEVMGILLFSLNRKYDQLVSYEKESIDSFINVVAVALYKALLDIQLKDLNRRLKSVNTMLSHDIKGVLGKNKDMFRVLLDQDYGPVPDRLKPFVEQSFHDTEQLVHSVIEILESGENFTLKVSSFDLKEAVLDIVKNTKPDADKKELTLEVDIKDDNYTINADKSQITTHVLRNLIENAVNYNVNKGNIKISLSKKDQNSFLFSVKDTGVGINDEDKKNIFKEGGHGKDSIKINVHSSGYGLSIAKRTVESHKGKIWFETEVGKGTVFFVELPISQN